MAIMRLCAEDMTYVCAGETVHGKEPVRGLDEQILAILPDHWRRVERLLVDGDVVVAWIVLGGTLAHDGKPFEADVCASSKSATTSSRKSPSTPTVPGCAAASSLRCKGPTARASASSAFLQ